MPDDTSTKTLIADGALRFPGADAILSPGELSELEEGGATDTLIKTAMSVARPSDRALVLGGGSGLIPVLLGLRLGLRHLAIVERETDRLAYLSEVLSENRLIRATCHVAAPADFQPTLIISDLARGPAAALPDLGKMDGLRALVLRLPETRPEIAQVFDLATFGGLTYFPRQSCGNVVTFLSRWHQAAGTAAMP
ncbi:hypothetical protein [Tropicimonas sediminicola]|uniref:Uncharacterized protein n=1 Tax=Tropicimonas sediminicola TaxID=1031541 RepID=A0A239DB13_9RHOB|nr:hypothetical protein [Tropicimonas sediminicola]SNS29500.1 hypothetical protein SAMN05421757_101734 [Tropicimonas sediminicola]